MFGGAALSNVTAKTWPISDAATANGLGAGMTFALGGPRISLTSKTRNDGPAKLMKVQAAGSTPCGTSVGAIAPENPATAATPGGAIAAAACARATVVKARSDATSASANGASARAKRSRAALFRQVLVLVCRLSSSRDAMTGLAILATRT